MDRVAEELDALYARINREGEKAIQNGREVVDPFLNNMDADERLGLTLQIDMRGTTNDIYEKAVKRIREIEPGLYIYPDSDLHITVMEFISATRGFVRDGDRNDKMIELIENALCGAARFDLEFKGLIVSDAAVLGKGYYRQGLNQIRNKLRSLAREQQVGLEQRYHRTSAHFTGMRFRSTLKNRSEFLKIVQEYNFAAIGSLRVDELELVVHDWYNRRKEIIKKFVLA